MISINLCAFDPSERIQTFSYDIPHYIISALNTTPLFPVKLIDCAGSPPSGTTGVQIINLIKMDL